MKLFNRAALLLCPLAFAAAIASVSSIAFASETALNYLPIGQPVAAELLAPPPLIDSPEQAADMAAVKAVYHSATSNDIAAAYSEKKFSVFNFTAAVGEFFQSNNLPKTAAFFEKVQLDAETLTDLGKDYFHRPRPYSTDTNLINGKLEKSFSYPSGHSTESMVLALVLAEAVPAQHDAIITHARMMGWHRIQIARHYPTDIYAGRVLAQAIVGEMNKSETFEKELTEVRNEIEAARTTVKILDSKG